MSETMGRYLSGRDCGDEQPERPEPAGGAGEAELREALNAVLRGVTRRSTGRPRDGELLHTAVTELVVLRADLAEARRALAAAEAEVARLKEQASVLLRETTTYWEALTDLIIGAEQQSQSHADVIARASEALVAAKSVTEPGG